MATGISYPDSLPAFLAKGHDREELPVFDLAEMDTGAARWRRRFTSTPQFASVSTWLRQSQFDVFFDWFEDVLHAGALSFHVRIAGPSFSSGLEWWEARFVEPYRAPYKNGGRYLVSARLRLVAGPFESAPSAPLAAEGKATATGDADLTVSHGLAAEGTARAVGDAEIHLVQHLEAEGTASAEGDATLGIERALAAEGTAGASGAAELSAGGSDDDLARSWLGLNITLASVAASDDSLASEWMGL